MRSSSAVRLYLAAGVVALFAAGCGSANNPASPMALAGSNTSQKGGSSAAGKVDVCHLNDTGGFQLINVSANSLQAHLAHGDGQPGGDVQNSPIQIFGTSCQVITLKKYEFTLASGAGGTTGQPDLAVKYSKATGTGNPIVLDTHPAYASLSGARWVIWKTLFEGSNLYGAAHVGDDVSYSMFFTLPAGAKNVSLSGTFFADNRGDAFLNGALIGGHPGGMFDPGYGTPAAMSATSGFVTGSNALSVKVQDWGGIAGVTFKAVVTYFAQ